MKFRNRIVPLASLLSLLAACTSAPLKDAKDVTKEVTKPIATAPTTKPTETTTKPTGTNATIPAPKPPINYAQVYKQASFADLPGWLQDDQREVWPALINSCNALKNRLDWKDICRVASGIDSTSLVEVRLFFEQYFNVHRIQNSEGGLEGMATGYYEPLLTGSRAKSGVFQTALYKTPSDMLTIEMGEVYPDLKNMRLRGRVVGNKVLPYPSRADILPSLTGNEIVYVDDAVDAFFLQIQGSGRVRLAETDEVIRLAYADQNGHPYKSIGRYLVDKGELKLEQASAQGIKEWIIKNPARKDELLNANPSMVFFKEEKLLDPSIGPKGALGVPLVGQRSIAIDPQHLPLGAPVFLATTYPNTDKPLQRIMMAQDTGGAIRGPVRADFFWGFGKEAGELAGRMKQKLAMWVLLPKNANKPS
jgi:membrane-bound lytic murein transglycosylase A